MTDRANQNPTEDPRLVLAAKISVAAATAWFVAAAAWELLAPFGAGHVASSTAIGIAAENMWQWGIAAPVTHYSFDEPSPGEYYCHHPWGIFWVTAWWIHVFGHHDWVCRIPAIVWSGLTPPLLFAIGRRIWGCTAGAAAACAFVVLPIALSFAAFNSLEVPVMLGTLVMTWGYLRFTESWRRRWMAVSLGGLWFALHADWAAFVFGAVVLVFMLGRGILFRGWYPPVNERRFSQWWALASCTGVAVFAFYLWAFSDAGQLARFLAQGELRAQGSGEALGTVLESRRHWIELMFTPPAIALGKLALPVVLLRLVWLRKDAEIFGLATLAMATVQYVMFRQGADIHIFWPHYFAQYFAFAIGALSAGALDAARWLLARFGRRSHPAAAPAAVLGGSVLVLASLLPDGARALAYGHRTGLRFDERGYLIHQDVDKTAALRWLAPRIEGGAGVQVDASMKPSWALDWALSRPVHSGSVPTTREDGRRRYFVGDGRFSTGAALSALARAFRADVVGPFWIVDRARRAGPLQAFELAREEPGLFRWYWSNGVDPVYTVVPDPFATWELRHHFDQGPNPPPRGEARGLEQLRAVHNVAVAAGDEPRAKRLRAALDAQLDRRARRELPGGHRLLGTHFEPGVAPRLSVVVLAAGPVPRGASFRIDAVVEDAPTLSWTPSPERPRAVGMPFALPAEVWRPGFVYSAITEIRKRPGIETFYGYWGRRITPAPTAPSSARPPEAVELLRLE